MEGGKEGASNTASLLASFPPFSSLLLHNEGTEQSTLISGPRPKPRLLPFLPPGANGQRAPLTLQQRAAGGGAPPSLSLSPARLLGPPSDGGNFSADTGEN